MIKTSAVIALAAALYPACAGAVDGQVLINQTTVMTAGGFPYKITQPGSYKLSGNLTVTGVVDGIDILASNVTLDLNGFSIIGPIGCSGAPPTCAGNAGNGVQANLLSGFVTVKNGIIQGFNIGVFLMVPANLVDLQATANVGAGIATTAAGTVIARCQTSFNGGTGISASFATISDSTANYNGNDGFVVSKSTLTHSVANRNANYGIQAIGGVLTQNMVDFNTTAGVNFVVNQPSTLFGSNTITNTVSGHDLLQPAGALSQNNNLCSLGSC